MSDGSSQRRRELALLLEAVQYSAKRVRDPAQSVRLRGLAQRLEELLLDAAGAERVLRLSPPEQDVLVRQVETYCAELTGRGASPEGREQARQLREIVAGFRDEGSLRGFWRRLFGRR